MKTALVSIQSLLISSWCLTVLKASAAMCPDKGPLKVLVRKLPRDQAFVLCHLLNRIQWEGGGNRQLHKTVSGTFTQKPQIQSQPEGYWSFNPSTSAQRHHQFSTNYVSPKKGFQFYPRQLTTPNFQTLSEMIHVDNQFDENRERQIMRQAEIQERYLAQKSPAARLQTERAFIDHLKKHRLDVSNGGTSTIMDSGRGEDELYTMAKDDGEPIQQELQDVGDGTIRFQEEGILINPKPWEQHKRNT